ncbi:hypothetical protein SAMN02799630_06010 [Paenibacillus sp. UNCCL117]|nr:hypothetical protein SAMN04488602_1393 [Paenibacillus sp. cl123]SFW70401.1 hypothetical protein SAMN02799630_06010 [Paenibacillus sp. UNCCL117]
MAYNSFLGKWNDTQAATGKWLSYNICAAQLPSRKAESAGLARANSDLNYGIALPLRHAEQRGKAEIKLISRQLESTTIGNPSLYAWP